MVFGIVLFLVFDVGQNPVRLQSLSGMILIILVEFITSTNPAKVNLIKNKLYFNLENKNIINIIVNYYCTILYKRNTEGVIPTRAFNHSNTL